MQNSEMHNKNVSSPFYSFNVKIVVSKPQEMVSKDARPLGVYTCLFDL